MYLHIQSAINCSEYMIVKKVVKKALYLEKKKRIHKGSIDFYKEWDEIIGFRNQNEFFY